MGKLNEKYGYEPSAEKINAFLSDIDSASKALSSEKVLKDCFSMLDVTTLKTTDTPESVRKFVGRLNSFKRDYPTYPMPASVCVYSNFASVVRETLEDKEVHATVTSACFPSSQSFLEVKLLECEKAVLSGADEVDIVLAHNAFLGGEYDRASEEIRAVRRTVNDAAASQGRSVILKVILETGVIPTLSDVAEAAFLAIEAGADFIKTSTGKVEVNATPEVAVVMCECIKAYYQKTGKMIGFKPAGGMSTAADALKYYYIVKTILGEKWLCKKYFRYGVSRMANNLVSEIEGEKRVVL